MSAGVAARLLSRRRKLAVHGDSEGRGHPIKRLELRRTGRQQVPLARISFIDAMRWLRDAKADTRLTALLTNPLRPNRLEPRVLKRRQKEYARMTKPRDVLRKALLSKKHAA